MDTPGNKFYCVMPSTEDGELVIVELTVTEVRPTRVYFKADRRIDRFAISLGSLSAQQKRYLPAGAFQLQDDTPFKAACRFLKGRKFAVEAAQENLDRNVEVRNAAEELARKNMPADHAGVIEWECDCLLSWHKPEHQRQDRRMKQGTRMGAVITRNETSGYDVTDLEGWKSSRISATAFTLVIE